MYFYCYVCSVYSVLLCCSMYCLCACTVLLPPGVNQIAVNKIYHIIIKTRKTLQKKEWREEVENGRGSRRNVDKT